MNAVKMSANIPITPEELYSKLQNYFNYERLGKAKDLIDDLELDKHKIFKMINGDVILYNAHRLFHDSLLVATQWMIDNNKTRLVDYYMQYPYLVDAFPLRSV